jgi:hypothetical protein
VLTWIALGEPWTKERLDETGFESLQQWLTSNLDAVLEALDARAAREPFCAVARHLTQWGAAARDERFYADRFLSPRGPRTLRTLRARARQRTGQLVSYADVAAELRVEMESNRCARILLDQATRDLIEALRAEQIIAYGQEDLPDGQPNKNARHDPIPFNVFIHPVVTVTLWNTVAADANAPIAEWAARRKPNYTDVRFKTADVLALWPVEPPQDGASHERTDVELASASDRTGVQGRPTSRHLVEQEFRRRIDRGEACKYVGAEARALADWLKETHPSFARMTAATVENMIRDEHRRRVREQSTK